METFQDARALAESMTATTIQQNEILKKELDDAKKQVKALETSRSELRQELNKSLKDKVQLEVGCIRGLLVMI